MKVLFVNPAREGFFLITERQVPLGIYYLMDSCKKAGFEVELIDMLIGKILPQTIPFERLSSEQKKRISFNPIFNDYVRLGIADEEVIKKIEQYRPSVVCISIMFSCFHDSAERLAQTIKKRFPHIVIVAGGAHITTNYKEVLRNGVIDYCLRYEGEKTLPTLLKLIECKMPVDCVDGVAYGQNPVVINDDHTWINDLDSINPAYDIISPENYNRTITIITSRGCPFACEFCTVHLSMGRRYRVRSVQNVIDELRIYARKGFKRFNIEDDNFTFDIDRAKAICKGIIEQKINCDIYLLNGIAAKSLDEECISLMAAAGVKKLFLGLETTSDKLLSTLKKEHTSLQLIKAMVRLCNSYGINAGASLIIGFPSQTLEDILIDITTLINSDIPIYAFNALYPLPGTEIYTECIKQGLLTGNEDFIFLGSDNFVIHNNSFSSEDLYYLWVCIKGYSKWGIMNAKYHTLDSLGVDEALLLIADFLGGRVNNSTLEVPTCNVNAELMSGHYKVFVDMTKSFLYLLSGSWFDCDVMEEDNVVIKYTSSKSQIPVALVKLKDKLLEKR